jgi:hypothetical protein
LVEAPILSREPTAQRLLWGDPLLSAFRPQRLSGMQLLPTILSAFLPLLLQAIQGAHLPTILKTLLTELVLCPPLATLPLQRLPARQSALLNAWRQPTMH